MERVSGCGGAGRPARGPGSGLRTARPPGARAGARAVAAGHRAHPQARGAGGPAAGRPLPCAPLPSRGLSPRPLPRRAGTPGTRARARAAEPAAGRADHGAGPARALRAARAVRAGRAGRLRRLDRGLGAGGRAAAPRAAGRPPRALHGREEPAHPGGAGRSRRSAARGRAPGDGRDTRRAVPGGPERGACRGVLRGCAGVSPAPAQIGSLSHGPPCRTAVPEPARS